MYWVLKNILKSFEKKLQTRSSLRANVHPKVLTAFQTLNIDVTGIFGLMPDSNFYVTVFII